MRFPNHCLKWAVAGSLAAAFWGSCLGAGKENAGTSTLRLPTARAGTVYSVDLNEVLRQEGVAFRVDGKDTTSALTWRLVEGAVPRLRLSPSGTLTGRIVGPAASDEKTLGVEVGIDGRPDLGLVFLEFSLPVAASKLQLVPVSTVPSGTSPPRPRPDSRASSAPGRRRSAIEPDQGDSEAAPAPDPKPAENPSSGSDTGEGSDESSSARQAPDTGGDRYYFSAGTVLSKEREDFSQTDLYLSFDLDRQWRQKNQARIRFNTFFGARMTSLPVASVEVSEPTPGAGTSGKHAAGPPLQLDPAPIDQAFIRSRKSALIYIGGYLPILVTPEEDSSLFVAPIAKGGIQTITSSLESGTRPSEGNSIRSISNDDVFNSFSFGARVGRFAELKEGVPDLRSYLDVTCGRFENFQILGPSGNVERRWRWEAEGRLEIPTSVPIFLGFDANMGDGPDDVRFLFGLKFDIEDLFHALHGKQEGGTDGNRSSTNPAQTPPAG